MVLDVDAVVVGQRQLYRGSDFDRQSAVSIVDARFVPEQSMVTPGR